MTTWRIATAPSSARPRPQRSRRPATRATRDSAAPLGESSSASPSYLRSPLAQKPFVRVGNQHVLPDNAAPPSVYALLMLAHMPLFRNEHHDAMALLYHHLTQTLPRQEAIQLCGKKVVAQPRLVLGDLLPNRNAADADVVLAITWLELMARLGFLKKNDNWCKLYERFLDDRDAIPVLRSTTRATTQHYMIVQS